MRLSPLDIQHMEFERGVSGYRTVQVRAFLERVAAEREELLKELQAARDQVADQQRRIETLESAETDLRQAIVAAERVGSQMKDNARYEARLLVEEARAQRLAVDADIGRLRALRDDFRERFRAMLDAYERSLDATTAVLDDADDTLSEADLHDDDSAG
jgi:cell division initiation protein